MDLPRWEHDYLFAPIVLSKKSNVACNALSDALRVCSWVGSINGQRVLRRASARPLEVRQGVLLQNIPNDTTRIACRENTGRDVARDHTASADYRARSDMDAC